MKLKIQVRVMDDGTLAAQCRTCDPWWEGNRLVQEGEGRLVKAYHGALTELQEHAIQVHGA